MSFFSPSPVSLAPPWLSPPPTTFLPRESLLVPLSVFSSPKCPPRTHPQWSRLSALQRKFCPSAPFRKMISPKSLGKKFIIFNRFCYQPRPGGIRVPRKSKLINGLPRVVEGGWEGRSTKPTCDFFLSFAMVRILNRKPKVPSS